VASGEYTLLARFGVHYSFAILAILMIDCGGSIVLARMVARRSVREIPGDDVWQAFCEMSAIRLLMASLIGAAAAVYARGFASDEFSRWYVALALPGLLLWAVNAVGLLDGMRMSGVSGITGSAAYLFTAGGLALAARRSDGIAGAILGGAFSLGYIVTLVAQWGVLARKGWFPRYRKPARAGLLKLGKNSCALLFQLVPGQVNMRAQLVLSTAYLGVEMTALFIYAKQVVTALTQILGFVLRVEFPALVDRFAGTGGQTFSSIIGAQRTSLYLSIASTIATLAVSGTATLVPGFSLHKAAVVMTVFAPTIWTVSLSMMMTQGLAAMGAYAVSARALAISSVAGIVVTYLLIPALQIYGMVLGELSFHIVGFFIVYRYLRGAEAGRVPAEEASVPFA
jgi:O-antigen/teichoic acid export membrane protein